MYGTLDVAFSKLHIPIYFTLIKPVEIILSVDKLSGHSAIIMTFLNISFGKVLVIKYLLVHSEKAPPPACIQT